MKSLDLHLFKIDDIRVQGKYNTGICCHRYHRYHQSRLCDTIRSLSNETVKSITARDWILSMF
jgi:hypothetical protein